MKRKILTGITFGMIAGVIDVTPMIIQKLPLSADISAFIMWTAAGFLIFTTELPVRGIFKGIIISFLVLLPAAVIIAEKEPWSLLPISIMTLILGSALGYLSNKIQR